MNSRSSIAILVCIVSCLAFTLSASETSPERARPIGKIVAIVNGEIVTGYDLNQMLLSNKEYIALLNGSAPDNEAALRKKKREVLEYLVDRLLLISEGKKMGIQPDKNYIDQQVEAAMQSVNVTTKAAFEEILLRQGLTLELVRKDYSAEYIRQAVIDREVRSRVNISEAQIIAYFEENNANLAPAERVNFAQVLFRVDDFLDKRMVKASRVKAKAFLLSIEGGQSFEDACEKAEGAAKSCDGLGFLKRDEMFPAMSDIVFGLKIGQVSDVIESPMGFHVIKLLNKQHDEAILTPELKKEIKSKLFFDEYMKRYDTFVQELKQRSYIKMVLDAP
ncbi:SurA N-terminal domain-containing protein [bacterium]|nr:SurA N-terminal domain-containing protein [bacterium]